MCLVSLGELLGLMSPTSSLFSRRECFKLEETVTGPGITRLWAVREVCDFLQSTHSWDSCSVGVLEAARRQDAFGFILLPVSPQFEF